MRNIIGIKFATLKFLMNFYTFKLQCSVMVHFRRKKNKPFAIVKYYRLNILYKIGTGL